MSFLEQLHRFLQLHIEQISRDVHSIADGKAQLNLMLFPESFLLELSLMARSLFEKESSLISITPPLIIVGDLHGHLLNLYQILSKYDIPPNTKYLFLGDIVDRGAFSLETVSLIFALKVCYPNNIYLIRGNHEFSCVSLVGGFFEELFNIYGTQSIFDSFCTAFEYIPIAAKVGTYICLHGGISPELKKLDQIEKIKRPAKEYDDPILCGTIWSDPSDEAEPFQISHRGVGFLFGEKSLTKFLINNKLRLLIRAHECVDGYAFQFNNRCVTVFSASNYCGYIQNQASVLQILVDFSVVPVKLPFIKYLSRSKAAFDAPIGTARSGISNLNRNFGNLSFNSSTNQKHNSNQEQNRNQNQKPQQNLPPKNPNQSQSQQILQNLNLFQNQSLQNLNLNRNGNINQNQSMQNLNVNQLQLIQNQNHSLQNLNLNRNQNQSIPQLIQKQNQNQPQISQNHHQQKPNFRENEQQKTLLCSRRAGSAIMIAKKRKYRNAFSTSSIPKDLFTSYQSIDGNGTKTNIMEIKNANNCEKDADIDVNHNEDDNLNKIDDIISENGLNYYKISTHDIDCIDALANEKNKEVFVSQISNSRKKMQSMQRMLKGEMKRRTNRVAYSDQIQASFSLLNIQMKMNSNE